MAMDMIRTTLLMLFFAAIQLWTTCQLVADERPNIVVILCDDLGYGDLECYGHPHIKTPHLNDLAKRGIRFTDFYSAAPVCSPSRVGLLTGRSPNRAGVYDWIPPAGNSPRPDAREQVHMRSSEITIARLLKNAGYDTCMSGKWHCNSRFNHDGQPQPDDAGFDHWFATQNNSAPSHENPENYVRNGEQVGPLKGFSCQLVVEEAVNWLDRRSDVLADKPFFLYVAFHEPHEPIASPMSLVAKYRDAAKTIDEAQYFANVANVDLAVGRLMKALEERKLRDDTLVIFTSDNGPETLNRYPNANRSFGTATPLRGMKLHTHDAGFRVPGIMSWPGTIKAGTVSSIPASSLDFLPTFCELAETNLPAEVTFDGTNIVSLLRGDTFLRQEPLFWVYFNALNEARVAMRDGQWKVLARLNGGDFPRLQNVTQERVKSIKAAQLTNFEIYDISSDTGETQNLVNSSDKPIRELQQKMTAKFQELIENSHAWQVQ